MKEDDKPGFAGFMFLLSIVATLCFSSFYFGWRCGQGYERNKALDAGAGRWEINEKTGERSFKYGR